jgi:pimeloyl-ACP methyl ester carboxylesterase
MRYGAKLLGCWSRLLTVLVGLVLLLPSACARKASRSSLALARCHLSAPSGGERIAAECGTLSVPEDPAQPAGRRIELFVAVLRATGSPVAPDPVFLIAGGPGGSITREFPKAASAFGRLNVHRDLVLLDQRGTGRSHPLGCAKPGSGLDEDAQQLRERLQSCIKGLDADLRYYGTSDAIVDLDRVRAALGYERINLYGGSYGTRVALAYARAYPERLRAMVLDGVVPFGLALGPNMARDAQRSLDGLFERCQSDASCKQTFPDSAADLRTLLTRLEAKVPVTLTHPSTAEPVTMTLSRRIAAGTIRMLSYTSETAALVPLLVHEAAAGNLAPLSAQALLAERLLELNEGMHFSVICSEDFPFFGQIDDHGTYLQGMAASDYGVACADWPKASLPDAFRDPVHSHAPTLLLSGALDPVTPPANAEYARATLPRSRHLIVQGEAHGIMHRGCVSHVVSTFFARLQTEDLDVACLAGHRPLPFFTSFKGPQP